MLLAAMAIPACTPGTTPISGAATSSPGSTGAAHAIEGGDLLTFPAEAAGVLTDLKLVTLHEDLEPDPRKGTIAVTLRACRWEWPGRMAYDLSWTPPPDLAVPATVRLALLTHQGDVADGFGVDVTLARAGEFSFAMTDAEVDAARPTDRRPTDPVSRWEGSRYGALSGTAVRCSVEVQSLHPATITPISIPASVTPVRPSVAAAPGTVAALLQHVDPDDPDDPLLPLADLLDEPGRPAIDTMWIAPTLPVELVRISLDGPCLVVASTYEVRPPGSGTSDRIPRASTGAGPAHAVADEDRVRVVQRRGCPPGAHPDDPGRPADAVIAIADPTWTVLIGGSTARVDSLIARLTALPWDSSPTAPR